MLKVVDNIDALSYRGDTALNYAVKLSQRECIEALCDSSASMDYITPNILSFKAEYEKIVQPSSKKIMRFGAKEMKRF